MAAKLHTSELFRQINPFPMRNWRAHQAEKLAPNVEAGKKALHDQNVEEYGPGYDTVTEDNFPYPLFYGFFLCAWVACIFMGATPSWRVPPNTGLPRLTFNDKNPDGSTKFPVNPEAPHPFFTDHLVIRA
eukprot:gene8682-13424_t